LESVDASDASGRTLMMERVTASLPSLDSDPFGSGFGQGHDLNFEIFFVRYVNCVTP
jgi:hypothetical protein